MQFIPTLNAGILVKRYKRFLADILLEDGNQITAHCPNSGSMRGCSTPGSPAYLSHSDNPQRKYQHTLEMIQEGETWIGVNTMRTNRIVTEAITEGIITELHDVRSIQSEVKTSPGSRLDLLLLRDNERIFVEIKNCSLVENGLALFPDAVTARGTKHLHELMRLAREGETAVIFFCVQRADAQLFQPAFHIDPVYARTLQMAHQQGVRILVYQADVSPEAITMTHALPFSLSPSLSS